MGMLNLYAGWIGMLLGCVAGAVPGLFFHGSDWLGGYTSWRRRMIRLAHIAFFGIGFVNVLFGLTVRTLQIQDGILLSSWLLVIGAITMPLECYLSAIDDRFRHLFFIPAVSVTLGIALFTWRLFTL